MVKIDLDATAGICPQGGGPGGQRDRVRANLFRHRPRVGHRPSWRELVARQAVIRLSGIASLTVITLLSVGLWALIWVAASSLAAVWLR